MNQRPRGARVALGLAAVTASLGAVFAACTAAAPASAPGVDGGVDGGSQEDAARTGAPGTSGGDGGDDARGGSDGEGGEGPVSDRSGAKEAAVDAAHESSSGLPAADAAGPCDAPGVVLCDDFEERALDSSMWTRLLQSSDPGSTLSLDTTRSRSGSQSLHVTISAAAGQAMISETRSFPMPMNKVYGRAYLYFGSPVLTDHVTFLDVSGTAPIEADYRFGAQYGDWIMNYASSASEDTLAGSPAVATGTWICLEWYFNGGAGEFHEYLDGNELTAAEGADAAAFAAPNFSAMRIGMEVYGNGASQPRYDLWVDALAVGTERVGCLP